MRLCEAPQRLQCMNKACLHIGSLTRLKELCLTWFSPIYDPQLSKWHGWLAKLLETLSFTRDNQSQTGIKSKPYKNYSIPFHNKRGHFYLCVCVCFGLVQFLTCGATQQSSKLMYNSVVGLFFQLINFWGVQFLLSGTISVPCVFSGCRWQILRMTRATKT